MSESNSKLSVCLLSYNHAHVLPQAIESILGQTFPDYELLISDDCSCDDSWRVVQDFVRRDARVRGLRTPRNAGMAANANFAITNARGEYVALLHHDDVLEPALFEKWLRIAEEDAAITFVFNDYLVEDKWIGHHAETFALSACMDGDTFLKNRLLRRWDCPVRGTALIRRSAFQGVGGIDERFGLLADIDLWMRLARGAKVGYVAEPLIRVYRRHHAGYPREYTGFTWERWRLLFDIHAANICRTFQGESFRRRIAYARLRMRVSREVFKWLVYAIVRGRADMLRGVAEGVSPHEALWLDVAARWTARGALLLIRLKGST